jgi:ubiquinone/menaquinone biosynthesis C-methylase UbiE
LPDFKAAPAHPNQMTYAAPGIVHHYAQLKALQPAEKILLDLLQHSLPRLKMLDIGIGGGRTTQHFYQSVAEYVGIDYSPEMIAACKKRFPASAATLFQVCDARDMSRFEENAFDVILFSFNGIDYVSPTDRLRIFQEIRRVGKPGAYFCFSSHNLQGLERAFDIRTQFSFNPVTTYANLVMWGFLRILNLPTTLFQLKALSYIVARDESHNFRLETYYVRPEAQLHQLAPNFSNIKVYSWKNDLELVSEHDRRSNVDMWLYYLCLIN